MFFFQRVKFAHVKQTVFEFTFAQNYFFLILRDCNNINFRVAIEEASHFIETERKAAGNILLADILATDIFKFTRSKKRKLRLDIVFINAVNVSGFKLGNELYIDCDIYERTRGLVPYNENHLKSKNYDSLEKILSGLTNT